MVFIQRIDYSYFIYKMDVLIKSAFLELGQEHILIKDTHYGNVMWDSKNKIFRFVDVDGWYRRDFLSENEIKQENLKKIIEMCADYVLGTNDTIYFHRAYNMDKSTDFVDFYENMRTILEKESGCNLKTVNEVREYVKRLK